MLPDEPSGPRLAISHLEVNEGGALRVDDGERELSETVIASPHLECARVVVADDRPCVSNVPHPVAPDQFTGLSLEATDHALGSDEVDVVRPRGLRAAELSGRRERRWIPLIEDNQVIGPATATSYEERQKKDGRDGDPRDPPGIG